jgi:hypothetical protein
LRTSLPQILILIAALLVTPVSFQVAAAEGAQVPMPEIGPVPGSAVPSSAIPQEPGAVDLSMLVVVGLGILGLIWVRRHTAEL